MEKGKISVVIPVYNGAAWLETCVESVLCQTWSNLEALILDGGSTDGTDRVAGRLEEKDSRVRYVRKGRQGVSASRNQGIEETSGEYLTFVDADDKTDMRMLELLAEGLEKTRSDLIACDFSVWSEGLESGRKASRRRLEGRKERADANAERSRGETAGEEPWESSLGHEGEAFDFEGDGLRIFDRERWLAEYLLCGNTRCWGILYRRQAVGKVRFREDLSIGEDMMFLMDLLPNLKQAAHLSYPGYFYRINQAGAMLRSFAPSYMDEIRSWKYAAEMVERDYPKYTDRVNSILAVSAMLAVGKLSQLSGEEPACYRDCTEKCHETVKAALKIPGARAKLPGGYRVKTALFQRSPALYMGLYRLWKRG